MIDFENITVDGQSVQAKWMGSGLFCEAYIDRSYQIVYLFCNAKEKSKDILENIKHPHLPFITKHQCENKKQSLYSMPFYRDAQEKHIESALDLLNALNNCLRTANYGGYNFKTGDWMMKHKSQYMYVIGTYGKNIPDGFREALTIMMDRLERTPKMRWYLDDSIHNFGLDNNDNLIMRDNLVVAKDLRWIVKKELAQS